MSRPIPGGYTGSTPAPQAGVLPPVYTPAIAVHAPGPFLDEQIVTPSTQKWMNARTYIVRDRTTRQEYRALRIQDHSGHFVGYWAIELMPSPLDLGSRFEGDREDAIADYLDAELQKDRDAYRRRRNRSNDV
jgi:hypothetical protein